MITEHYIQSNGINQFFLRKKGVGETLLLIHGNGSSSVFWKGLMNSLNESINCIAPDLRGYGQTESVPVDASKSYGDFVEDVMSLVSDLGIENYHLVGHSLGGGIAWETLLKDFKRAKSMTLINPASPYGFGGTKDEEGKLTYSDGAGSGGGLANPELIPWVNTEFQSETLTQRLKNSVDIFYWKSENAPANVEELLEGVLSMKQGEQFYPGDSVSSANFPFVAPGKYGQLNAAAPITKIGIGKQIVSIPKKVPIWWVRGDEDQIVSDQSQFDMATHGANGLISDYPGEVECPPQPMVGQTRAVLKAYALEGGFYQESVYENCGHSPHIEFPEKFSKELNEWISNIHE